MSRPMHVLVVGGTGMLRGVCVAFAQRGWTVSVVARRHAGLSALAYEAARRSASGIINPLPADYSDRGVLAARLRATRAAHGQVQVAVCWIHSNAPEAPMLVAEMVASERAPCRYFHVLGSSAADPLESVAADQGVAGMEGIAYRRIVLGFAIEEGLSRWLTDEEISQGVLEAVDRDEPEHIVGVVRPWEARPGRRV